MKTVHAVDYWFTTTEWGSDMRTGTTAVVTERERRPEDRSGKGKTVWVWLVRRYGAPQYLASGIAQTHKSARSAVRQFIRTLPDKE